ncbi:MAG TPA: MEDS domain-containing protein [Candidatus Angelobacter sp.]|nr:MEDS domain-containing protein [Candidatus Angelobacter sp.]
MASRRLVYQQGDHICTLYASPEEQLQAAVEYVKAGLARGEQCLYVCGEHTPEELRAALQASGVNVKEEEGRGALSLVTKAEAHLKDGHFNANNMISFLHQAVKDALDAGFNGLCAAGDMGWVTDGVPGTEELTEYESRLNEFYANNRALGLCQYNRKSLPSRFLDHCIATHRFVRIEGPIALENPFYEEPGVAIGREAATESETMQKIHKIFERKPPAQLHVPA